MGAGHTIPMVYATLAVLNETLCLKYNQTKDKKYLVTETLAADQVLVDYIADRLVSLGVSVPDMLNP